MHTANRFSSRSFKLTVAGVLLAAAGSFGLVAFAQDATPHHPPMHEMGMGMGMPLMGRGLDHMLDLVSATDAQRTQIKSISASAMADLKAQHASAKALHDQALTLFTQTTVDANAAETLREQMMAQHDTASKRVLQAMLDIANVLTPAQRQVLAAKVQQHEAAMAQRMASHQQSTQ